jgi:hypothetical protein
MNFPIILADAAIPFRDFVTQSAQRWMLTGANLYWAEGSDIMTAIIKIAVAICAGVIFIDILRGGTGEGAFGTVVYRLGRLVIAMWLIKYYNAPFYGDMPFHKLMPEAARQLATIADDGAVAVAQKQVDDFYEDMVEETDFDDLVDWLILLGIKAVISAYAGFMLFLSSGGYILMGIAVTVGPLSIPFLAFEKTAFLFWDWLGFWIGASMYQVIASVLTYIFANIQILSLPYFDGMDSFSIFGAELTLTLAVVLTALMIGGICAALYGKGAAAAANVGSAAMSAISTGIRFL